MASFIRSRSLHVAAAVSIASLPLSACQNGELPTVFGAVFGLQGAKAVGYREGEIPEKGVAPGDRLIGEAADDPGLCIYRDAAGGRFRAACPDGYEGP
ncbi:hypothetical protein [Consotaella aegiceratis]|uniref:hypothetical protein n=1 Tax=Consotaella aegiceratis TaxID=3097961 RepID=UPI002F40A4DB